MGVAMGARFAPSVANLFMALISCGSPRLPLTNGTSCIYMWPAVDTANHIQEEETVFGDCPSQLACYKRSIDDLIMIWEVDMLSLEAFMIRLNSKNINISFSWNINYSKYGVTRLGGI